VRDLARKNDTKFWFFGPVRFKGHFEEIGIAKVLFKSVEYYPRRVAKQP